MSFLNRTIHGYYEVPTAGNPIRVPFVGRLRLTRDKVTERVRGEIDGEIDGEIVDRYGAATIHGTLNKRILRFEKQYEGRSDIIIFSLTRGGYTNEEDSFVGCYRHKEKLQKVGQANCAISRRDLVSTSLGLNLAQTSMN